MPIFFITLFFYISNKILGKNFLFFFYVSGATAARPVGSGRGMVPATGDMVVGSH
jgi:hypothetical protein